MGAEIVGPAESPKDGGIADQVVSVAFDLIEDQGEARHRLRHLEDMALQCGRQGAGARLALDALHPFAKGVLRSRALANASCIELHSVIVAAYVALSGQRYSQHPVRRAPQTVGEHEHDNDLGTWAAGILVGIVLFIPACLLIWHAVKALAFAVLSPLGVIWNAARIPHVKRGYDPRRFVHTAEELGRIRESRSILAKYEQELAQANQIYRQTPKNKDGQLDLRYGGAREAAKAKESVPRQIEKTQKIIGVAQNAPFRRAQKFVAPIAYVEAAIGMWAATSVLMALAALLHAWFNFKSMVNAARYYVAASFWSEPASVGIAVMTILSVTGRIGSLWYKLAKRKAAEIVISDVDQLKAQLKNLPDWIAGISGPLEARLASDAVHADTNR